MTPAAAEAGCGAHGVDAIRVTGASTQGDGEDVVALCAIGEFTHGVPIGNWSFTIHQLDVRGRAIDVPQLDDQGEPVLDANGYPTLVPDPTATATVAKDATVDLDPGMVVLTPRPECSDGIDNDCDGRVDLDDPRVRGRGERQRSQGVRSRRRGLLSSRCDVGHLFPAAPPAGPTLAEADHRSADARP